MPQYKYEICIMEDYNIIYYIIYKSMITASMAADVHKTYTTNHW